MLWTSTSCCFALWQMTSSKTWQPTCSQPPKSHYSSGWTSSIRKCHYHLLRSFCFRLRRRRVANHRVIAIMERDIRQPICPSNVRDESELLAPLATLYHFASGYTANIKAYVKTRLVPPEFCLLPSGWLSLCCPVDPREFIRGRHGQAACRKRGFCCLWSRCEAAFP